MMTAVGRVKFSGIRFFESAATPAAPVAGQQSRPLRGIMISRRSRPDRSRPDSPGIHFRRSEMYRIRLSAGGAGQFVGPVDSGSESN